jgi:hypothetical protein
MKNLSLGLVASVSLLGCATEDGPTSTARLRIAHLSPDAPAVDVCIAPHGTTDFTGPVLAGAGAASGLAYGNVTKYLDVEAIQYDVRIVAPGAANCDQAVGGLADITDLPVLPEGASATISAIGRLDASTSQPFRLAAFIDDTEVTFGKAKLRVIHAAPGTAGVAVGFGGGVVFDPFIDNVQFGSTTQANNGYFEVSPIADGEITARDIVSGQDAISIKPVMVPAGAIVTAFAIGTAGNALSPLDVLLCIDNADANGLLSNCKKAGSAPERARLRIAHLSPDAPIVDVCLAAAGTTAWKGPILRELGATGLAYSQITTYVSFPVAAYDVRVISATSTGCEVGAVPDTKNVATSAGLTATVAAIGVVDPQGAAAQNPTFRLEILPDDTTTLAGKTKLRFFHASPGTPAVDVGLGVAHAFQRVFANVQFGQTGNNGFVTTDPFTNSITARLANATTDALVVPGVSSGSGTIYSAYAIGGKSGATNNPLRVLLCADSAPANGLLTQCTAAP